MTCVNYAGLASGPHDAADHRVEPGGAKSLLTHPALTSHAGMDPERRRSAGISDGLIRMSVGLESPDENVDDVLQALDTAAVGSTP